MGEAKRGLLRLLGRAGVLAPAYRVYERTRALLPGRAGAATDGLPVPPRRLIVRVAGTADVAWFLEGGRLAAETVREALRRHGASVERLGALLDFGCGCGRVLRNWAELARTEVAGSDTSDAAVDWCQRNLPFAEVASNALAPPLVFPESRFDLVYALSVFTHLPEDLQLAWIRELTRVLAPGGLLLLSTHGDWYLPRLTVAERDRFRRGELVVRWEEAVGTNLCAAYHPAEYLRGRLANGLEPLELVPQGARGNPHQDLFLLRKPT